jgi:outer membrane protein assembly factor BamB
MTSDTRIRSALPGAVVALLLCLCDPTLWAQDEQDQLSGVIQVDEIPADVAVRLERIERHLTDARWVEAAELAQQVMEESGERLMLIDKQQQFQHFIPVAQFCAGILARYSVGAPELLDRYRKRVDPRATLQFEKAISQRDAGGLRSLVERKFLSSVTDDALLTLGDWAMEAGRVDEARRCWERLSPETRDPLGRPAWMWQHDEPAPLAITAESWQTVEPFVPGWFYPDAEISAAEVWSRLIWASIVDRKLARAERELTVLEGLHPKSVGRIGGRSVELAPMLRELLQAAANAPEATPSKNWPTYGGTPSRGGVGSPGTRIGGRPAWSINLTEQQTSAIEPPLAESNRLLPHFPIVHHNTVFIREYRKLRAVDLLTGKARFSELSVGDHRDPAAVGLMTKMPDYRPEQPAIGEDRYSATAAGNYIALRSGLRVTYQSSDSLARMAADMRSNIVVLDLAAEGRLVDGFPRIPKGPEWTFDGVPILSRNKLFIAMRRVDDVQPSLAVACFEVPTARLIWRQFVVAAETTSGGQSAELTHSLLSLSADQLIINTNLGAVAALGQHDGRIHWLIRYPRSDYPVTDPERSDAHFQRDFVPSLLANDLAYFMPADSRRIFALDSNTGRLQWAAMQDAASDAKYILGVGEGQLLVSGDTLYWFDALSGRKRCQFPASYKHSLGFSRASPRGFGRGVLLGDRVLWSTQTHLFAFRQGRFEVANDVVTPLLAQPPISLAERGATGGHLIPADKMLLIAGPDRLTAFRRSK